MKFGFLKKKGEAPKTVTEDTLTEAAQTEAGEGVAAEAASPEAEEERLKVLRTDDLVKVYGRRTVVDHVSINVKQGEIVGL